MEQDWPRLAAYVRRARIGLGHETTVAWAKALEDKGSPLKLKTLQRIENGHQVGPNMLAILELEFDWPAGATTKILAGQDPFEVPVQTGPEPERAPPEPGVFDVTNAQLLDLADYAEKRIGREFSRELLRLLLDAQRAGAGMGDGTQQVSRRDAG